HFSGVSLFRNGAPGGIQGVDAGSGVPPLPRRFLHAPLAAPRRAGYALPGGCARALHPGTRSTTPPRGRRTAAWLSNRQPMPTAADVLESQLRQARAELERRLVAGDGARAETFFADFPELAAQSDCAVELIYAEFALREELGQAPPREEFYRR